MALWKFLKLLQNAEEDAWEAVALAVTVPQLVWLTACLVLDDQVAVTRFYEALFLVAEGAKASGCDIIMLAGCIPVIVECLRRWSTEQQFLLGGCKLLHRLTALGSTSVHAAIKSVPGITDTLEAADATGFVPIFTNESVGFKELASSWEMLGFVSVVSA